MAILRIKDYEKAEVVEFSLIMDGPNILLVAQATGSEFLAEVAVITNKGISLSPDLPPSFPLPLTRKGRIYVLV